MQTLPAIIVPNSKKSNSFKKVKLVAGRIVLEQQNQFYAELGWLKLSESYTNSLFSLNWITTSDILSSRLTCNSTQCR